jgi:tRNA(Ile)-lysidine synthase
LAANYSLVFYAKKFDVEAYCSTHKLSIQEAARNLRYSWFKEVMLSERYHALVTAHHADDSLETLIINIGRGTGLDGLVGIPERNEFVVRPLLPFTKDNIMSFAHSRNIEWREDASNEKNEYSRNLIRNKVVPAIKDLNKSFISSLLSTQKYLKQAQAMVADAAQLRAAEIIVEKSDKLHIKIAPLLNLPNFRGYLHYWLKDYNFTAWEDIYALPFSETGKVIHAKQYTLLKDRTELILAPVKKENVVTFSVDQSGYNDAGLQLQIEVVNQLHQITNESIIVEADLLSFPLTLRKWQQGDVFYPFGLKGKKLLSKYFKDEKCSFFEKGETWLLCSDSQIVWVVGKRADDRFKITAETKKILKISYS